MTVAESAREARATGAIYARADCASLARRILAGAVDFALLIGSFIAWWIVCFLSIPEGTAAGWIFFFGVVAFSTAYLAFVKRTEFGTLGYWLAGIKVVGLDGERPRWWPMVFRSILALVWMLSGSSLFVIDLLWIGGDEQRQSLRDKMAGTLVVRRSAKPVATGTQVVRLYSLIGWALYLREVKR